MYNISKRFIEPYDFLLYYSPSIPYDFPKEKIPKQLCEESLLLTYKCYTDFPKQTEEILRGEACDKYASEFNNCKKRRDMTLFHDIKEWETERFNSLKPPLKSLYINSIKEEHEQLMKKFEETPASDENSEKRWRINADIIQIRWRLDYLKKLIVDPS